MYLLSDDYKTLITDDDREVVEQASDVNRENAEKSAIEYFKGYLRSRYNVDSIFEQVGEDRNPTLLMFVMDEVLYTLHSTLPGNLMPEIRQIRKENLDKWLLDIQKGRTQPDFPTIDDEESTDQGNPMKFGGNKRLGSTW
ncbi:MAG: hypothetical protein QM503_04590 [Bacteroidota bacterium]